MRNVTVKRINVISSTHNLEILSFTKMKQQQESKNTEQRHIEEEYCVVTCGRLMNCLFFIRFEYAEQFEPHTTIHFVLSVRERHGMVA